ncbi:DUF3572 domain-containing protein [Magnetospirillum aberrantis]|uniref:DUF3572 domain-containing protein n=1 Tax=Magnetospirillum aberrantis SpK TaxID=908842 RepID=A0A7C9QSK9_9PROT|nr:DUF3572 domain-containing protein [Magnetospirillum aberrantis]NFV79525.1 DUF3572 domain-containing protein [Magnetospirillum aberrantis SpK]
MDPFKPYQPKSRPIAPAKLTAEDAQAVALKALTFVAGDESLLSRFVALSGCGFDDIKARLADIGFLAGVLDFMLADEQAVLAFAEAEGMSPETPMQARLKLMPVPHTP